MPDSWAAQRASAAFFLLTNAAPDEAFAIRIRASRAFCKRQMQHKHRKSERERERAQSSDLPAALCVYPRADFDDKFC